ncbi:FTR1 family protein [Paucibacter sp. R3-3]|uniref:FTR1 family protein n=1 Tax=Roseateles agri TaxID=3098619 RepID=A0ABU5DRQ1_9BURK|nr:FTR1 family protein [Paucibacter sp. R3-3]MDY0749005.1 FTR1 family protein [Paucibacter sp. R3-3]
MRLNTILQRQALILGFIACLFFPSAHAAEADVKRVWQILDYLGVDYAGAVKGGVVLSASEYGEMKEFAKTAREKIASLEAKPDQPALVDEAKTLEAAIEAKADPARVATLAKTLGTHLLASYPVPLAPTAIPDVQLGAKVYAANCASCHGITGNGDGPVGKTLDPTPIAFTDKDRARHRSIFALYQAVTQGIAGTAMPAFGQLSDQDRWAVATYLGSFAHDAQQVAQGEKLWAAGSKASAEVGSVERLVGLTEDDLSKSLGASEAGAVMAYLHVHPEALAKAQAGGLSLARERLHASLLAYEAGDASKAKDLALSSYLDGVEPYEQALAARDGSLKDRIEVEMGRYRSLLSQGAPASEAKAVAASIEQLFSDADKVLADSHADSTAAFFGSLTILLREGIEALLVVVAMIAFLRKAERREVLVYVHAGWVAALAAGGITWIAATYLVTISGANREVTEGLSSLFAAAVLLSVGVWMHQKSVAGQWQTYLRERMSAALDRKSAFFMFGLAFVAVYREVFETILFYAALWGQGSDGAIVAGLLTGIVGLVLITVLLLRFSARLPIGKFFSASSWLVAVLAVVLTGKGIAALQEAGWIAPSTLTAPRFEPLGVYPSTIGLIAQGAVLAFVLGFFFLNSRAARVRKN